MHWASCFWRGHLGHGILDTGIILTTATLPLSSLQETPLCCKLQWTTFLDPTEIVSGHVQNPSFAKDVFKRWALGQSDEIDHTSHAWMTQIEDVLGFSAFIAVLGCLTRLIPYPAIRKKCINSFSKIGLHSKSTHILDMYTILG